MQNISDNNTNREKISDEMLAQEITDTVLSVEGVCEFTNSIVDNLSINILGIDLGSKGIKISHSGNQLVIDIFITVDYGIFIPQLAWEIQSKIKDLVEELRSEKIKAININVNGVKFPKEEMIDE